jgi:peptide/nickel transport system permease protein
MITFLVRRLIQFIPTLLGVTLIIFILLNVMPGDAALLSGNPRGGTDPKVIEALREKWGLNDPLPIRYVRFLGNLVKGDLGISFRLDRKVSEVINERLFVTLRLATCAMLFAVIGGVGLGFFSAIHQGSAFDIIAMIGAVTGMSIPNFWLGLMLMYLVGVLLGILPTSGYGGGDLAHLILPAFTLGVRYMALLARMSRSAVLDVVHEDYVNTARSKGLAERAVQFRHIFRNALIPVITIAGLQFGGMLASTVVVETVFSWCGIGSLLVESIFRRDVPVLQGCILIIVVAFLVINLLVDMAYGYLDPRIQYD